jgi:Arc/MetJ family transcription regulator
MRTNIVIDDDLMKRALELSGLKTKRAVIEEALRLLIRIEEQSSILALRGQLHWEGDLNAMRDDHDEYDDQYDAG